MVGAVLLSVISNILNLTSIISVYLNAAVQGFVIIIVAFMQRRPAMKRVSDRQPRGRYPLNPNGDERMTKLTRSAGPGRRGDGGAAGARRRRAGAGQEGQPRRGHSRGHAQLHGRHRVLGQPGQEGPGEGAPEPEVTVKTAANAPEQANQLQDLLTVNKINALVIFPFESAALTKPVAQVKAKGVYVTVVDRGLTDTSAQDAYVSGDNTAFGKIPAEYLAKALNGKGNIVALRGIPTTIDNERMDAFNAVMKNHPDIKLLDAKHGNWNRDDAFKVMQDYLTRFKQIDAVWAADDDMAVGVLQGDRAGQAQGHQDRVRRRRRQGHGQDADGRQRPADPGQRLLLAEVHLRRDQADRPRRA